MFRGLRTVVYPVTDLGAAKAWYRRVLGFDPYFDQPFYVGFDVGGYELGLVPRQSGADGGPITYWGVPDAHEAVKALAGLGATLKDDPVDVGEGVIVASVRDPDGNVVGIIENPHFDPSRAR